MTELILSTAFGTLAIAMGLIAVNKKHHKRMLTYRGMWIGERRTQKSAYTELGPFPP